MTVIEGHNRLGRETSPYLLQHKDNPVHWWSWGEEALAEARLTGKPVLLSIGYAACHWCHVMAHESFEDPETARLMNELFVNIKVDREERPDIDAVYMAALHKLDEHGGWPLTMFLDADARPFWGGTYFPPEPRWGKPSFRNVLTELARIYREEPDKVRINAEAITSLLAEREDARPSSFIGEDVIADVASRITGVVDTRYGGLQGAPKFPQWSIFWLLWRAGVRYDSQPARKAVERTLVHIGQGGLYDHLGGGFARYSVDERWLVPHFEKMLYDNALLVDLMMEVWRETKEPLFAQRIEETVTWLTREMIAENGAFAASLDADSEGEEGKFYVWTKAEIVDVLGADDAELFASVYDVTEAGNFEGHVILNRLRSLDLGSDHEEARLRTMRAKLLERRAERIRPGWDDKVLADWNGLMIAALARASRVFARPEWLMLAVTAFDAIMRDMSSGDRLAHAWRLGRTTGPGTASDYANMIRAAIRLHEATGEDRFLDAARGWTTVLDRHHWEDTHGGYVTTADDTRDVIVRMKSAGDDATPSANTIMLSNLVQLFLLTGETRYADRARAVIDAFAVAVSKNPVAHCGLLAGALDLATLQVIAILSSGDTGASNALVETLNDLALPGALELVSAKAESLKSEALAGKSTVDGKPTAWVCVGTQCLPPVTDAAALRETLTRIRRRT